MTGTTRPRLAAKARLRWDPLEKKFFLLYPERGLMLSRVAHEIVQRCDGTRTVADIARELAALYPAETTQTLERETTIFLRELCARALIILVS